VVILSYALKALRHVGYDERAIKVILAGDEESGHVHSTMAKVFEEESRGALAAFNCETAGPEGALAVGRKGVIRAELAVKGVSVHAGREPEKGRSAILEMAHKVIDIHKLTDFATGITYNVGTITGGTVFNAVPDFAKVEIDVRFLKNDDIPVVTARLREIADRTYVPDTKTELTLLGDGGVVFRPMEKTEGSCRLFEYVRRVFRETGIEGPEPTAMVSGGGSDSAYSVLAGVPTVDQMGVMGQWNHSPREFAFVESLFAGMKLLVACVLEIENAGVQGASGGPG
jgi:glutamate carboxypeptidase